MSKCSGASSTRWRNARSIGPHSHECAHAHICITTTKCGSWYMDGEVRFCVVVSRSGFLSPSKPLATPELDSPVVNWERFFQSGAFGRVLSSLAVEDLHVNDSVKFGARLSQLRQVLNPTIPGFPQSLPNQTVRFRGKSGCQALTRPLAKIMDPLRCAWLVV